MIAIDTNLLVYAHRRGAPEHRRTQAALEAAAERQGWGIALPCLAEFWSVVTSPHSPGGGSSPRQAAGFLQNLLAAGCRIWAPEGNAMEAFLSLARTRAIRGARIFDLQIAWIAKASGAQEIWTHDSGFISIPGLRVVNPLAE